MRRPAAAQAARRSPGAGRPHPAGRPSAGRGTSHARGAGNGPAGLCFPAPDSAGGRNPCRRPCWRGLRLRRRFRWRATSHRDRVRAQGCRAVCAKSGNGPLPVRARGLPPQWRARLRCRRQGDHQGDRSRVRPACVAGADPRGLTWTQRAVQRRMPVSRPGAATARLRVPGTASGVNPRLPRRATRDGGRGSRALHWAFSATVARLRVWRATAATAH